MKNVSFSYKGHDRLVLRNININFESKKRYAVVGESGSGKSTLVKLLLKFYKCTAGDIEINNCNINKLNPCSLYKSIRYISQNTFLFHDTFRNNITLYNKYTEEELLGH